MDIGETFRPEDLSKTDFFDFVTAPEMGIGIGVTDRPPSNSQNPNTPNDSSLQDYDHLWSSDKEPNRLDTRIFEDLDKYCWQQQHHHQQNNHESQNQHQSHHQQQQSQQNDTSSSSNSINTNSLTCLTHQTSSATNINNSNNISTTDGQIYTLTVLNGTEPWLKKDPDVATVATATSTLDLDSLLGNFSAYVKSEFPYDDSFSIENSIKGDELSQHQQQQRQIQDSLEIPIAAVASAIGTTTTSTNLVQQFQNNNNDWHIANNNATEQNSPESLLRSALQGKGYSRGLHLQHGSDALSTNQNSIKDEELRKALFSTEQENLTFIDSTLPPPIYEDTRSAIVSAHHQSQTPQSSQQPSIVTASSCNTNTNSNQSTTTGIIVDDMFLSLETAFTDDFEKIKRIANEVQQFCSNNNYPEVIMEITAMQHHTTQNIAQHSQTPTAPHSPQPPAPPPQPSQPEVTTSNSSAPALSSVTKSSSKKYKRSTLNNNSNCNNNNNSTTSLTNNNGSPTHSNIQRKERSLHYCSICSKGFKDKYSVNVHIRTHTGEKPFACSLCGKSFRQKAHLAKHYQTHLAQKGNGGVIKGGKQQSLNRSGGTTVQISSAHSQRTQSSSNNTSTTTNLTLTHTNGHLTNR